MDRPEALERLLLSVAAREPDALIHVADQSQSFDLDRHEALGKRLVAAGLHRRPRVHRLPFDCGVTAARSHLIESTGADYLLSLDDDFVFTAETDVGALVQLLDARPDAGVAGGSVVGSAGARNVGTRLRRHGESSLHQTEAQGPFEECHGIRFTQVDCVPMFALMRRELFAEISWDPALKTSGEHLDFFLRMQDTRFGVLYAPDVTVDHPPSGAAPDYVQRRLRGEFLERMLAKHGLRQLKAVSGTVFELRPDGELTMYCELGPKVEAP
jgi:glycosyl transferase family 2